MRNAFVVAEFQALRIDQDQPDLIRSRFVQDGHDHGVDRDTFAGARRPRDQQVRHSRKIGCDHAAVDVFAHRHGELRLRAQELLRLDVLAQEDDFALAVGHLNPDRAFARHPLDQNAFRLQRQAQVIREIGDAAVLDPGFRFELKRGDNRPGIDLRDLAVNFKLRVFLGEHLSQQLELTGVNGGLLIRSLQQAARRQLVSARNARHGGFGLLPLVGALGDFRSLRSRRRRRYGLGQDPAARRLCRSRSCCLFIQHAFDAGAARFDRREGRGWTGRNQLRLYDWPRTAALLQFLLQALLGAFLLPILVTVPQRGDESEARRSPHPKRGEGKCRGKIECHRQNRAADDVGARDVQIVDQEIAQNSSQQSFDGNHAHPAQIARQQGQQRGNERHQPHRAKRLRQGRWHFGGAEPADAEHHGKNRQQKGAQSEELQHRVRGVSPDNADPVARRVRSAQHRSAVP